MNKVSVSILSSSINSRDIISEVNKSNADYIHLDIMDGLFTNNKTWNIDEIKELLNNNSKKLDVHLMVKDNIKYINDFIAINPEYITFHLESSNDIMNEINLIEKHNIKVGLSVKPKTDIKEIYKYLDYIDLVLVMSVEPGASGQSFIEETIYKIKDLKEEITNRNLNTVISVDGGINDITGKKCINAGANMLVSASYIHKDIKNNINILKEIKY